MNVLYVWKDKKLETISIPGRSARLGQAKEHQILDLFCMDTTCEVNYGRHGMFTATGWEEIPFNEFPPEFRMHLLLLGVS